MSAALKPYPEYRDSGVDWLGQVPAHWEVVRLKRLAEINPTLRPESIALATQAVFLPMKAVGVQGHVNCDDVRPVSDLRTGFTTFERGDVLVAKITPCFENGKGAALVRLPELIGFGSTEFHVLRPRGKSDARWLYYWTRARPFRDVGTNSMVGAAGQQRVPSRFFADSPVPTPSPEEQRRIADFLDAYTAQVHRLIAAKRRTIALWNEARLAKIAFVLGAGSAADADLSGGPQWWSSVPNGWSVARLRSLLRTKSGDMIDGADEVAEGIPIYGGNGIRGYAPRANTTGPILLLGRVGAKCGCVHFVEGPLWASEHALRVYPKLEIDLQYLRLLLELTDLNRYAISTAQPLITGRIVGEQTTLLAPRDLQQGLAAQAIGQAAEVDDAIAKLVAEIDLILEYRDSLIAAVVTGRLDVRDAAIPFVEGDDFADDTATDDEDMEDALDAVD